MVKPNVVRPWSAVGGDSNLTLSSGELLVTDKSSGPWVHGGHGLTDSLHGSGLNTELVGRGLEERVEEGS